MKKLAILLPLLAGIAATPANAQISGRVEGRVGWDEARADLTVQNSNFTSDFGASDVTFGIEAGGDVRISNLVVGAYVGFETSEVDDCVDRPFFRIASSRQDVACIGAEHNLTAGARVGIAVGDEGLIYAKGGISRGRFSGSYNPTPTTQLFTAEETVSGWHVGGGFELNLSRNFYAKAEYVMHRYDDAFTGSLTGTDRFDPSRRQLIAGVGFRFGATGNR